MDKNLDFEEHLSVVCKKASQNVSALARLARILSFPKRKLILNTFIESQFSYCPLVWMFCSRKLNRKINYIHERALRLVYDDYTSTFEELLNIVETCSNSYEKLKLDLETQLQSVSQENKEFRNILLDNARNIRLNTTRPVVNLSSFGASADSSLNF